MGTLYPSSAPAGAPALASLRGTLMSLPEGIATPRSDLVHARGGAPCFPEAPSGCQPGRSPQRSKERAERPGDGCPCVGAEETCGVLPQPAGRGRTPAPPRPSPGHASQEPASCRSYPAAHSREREPNAPRSAQPPASNQRQRQPQRCRCAPPARVRPNRQCR